MTATSANSPPADVEPSGSRRRWFARTVVVALVLAGVVVTSWPVAVTVVHNHQNVAAADATLPARGIYCHPTAITAITTVSGRKLPVESPGCHRVLPAVTADAATPAALV